MKNGGITYPTVSDIGSCSRCEGNMKKNAVKCKLHLQDIGALVQAMLRYASPNALHATLECVISNKQPDNGLKQVRGPASNVISSLKGKRQTDICSGPWWLTIGISKVQGYLPSMHKIAPPIDCRITTYHCGVPSLPMQCTSHACCIIKYDVLCNQYHAFRIPGVARSQ